MDNKLFTVLEVAVIGGLILAVMYFGGVFDSKPAPTVVPLTPAPSLTPTAPGPTPTATPRPTHIPFPTVEPSLTPTTPAILQPTGLIAFETRRDGNSEIYTIQADGSRLTNLTHNSADDFAFTWSPDGSQIAFLSNRTGWLEVFVMNADGSNVTKISRLERTNTVYSPPFAWSPDGRYILAIQSPAWYVPHSENAQALHLLRSDGSGVEATLYQSSSYIWNPG